MEYILSDIIELIGGGTPKTSVPEYWNGDIPWLSVKDFSGDYRYVYETEKCITEEGLNNSSTKYLNQDDIIVSARGTVGELAMVPYPMTFNQSCYGIRAKRQLVDPFYLYYLMKYNLGELKSKVHGSVFDTITKDTFKQITVDVPALEIQKKVADLLGILDDKIETNDKINRNLSEQLISVFKSWFIDFDPFEGEMPSVWEVLKFEDFITLKNEKSNDNSIPMYAVTDTGIYPRDKKFNKNLSKAGSSFKVVRKNNLVFGMSREILNWGILNDEIAGVSSAYTVYGINSNINSLYLEYYIKLRTKYFREIIRLASREGQGIDRGVLLQKELYVPDEEWMNKFTELSKVLLDKIKKVNTENERLISIRDSLLPRLMSGEIDVTDLDI